MKDKPKTISHLYTPLFKSFEIYLRHWPTGRIEWRNNLLEMGAYGLGREGNRQELMQGHDMQWEWYGIITSDSIHLFCMMANGCPVYLQSIWMYTSLIWTWFQVPYVVTCNSAVASCAKRSAWRTSMLCLEIMSGCRVSLNSASFSSILTGTLQWCFVLDVLNGMGTRQVLPDVVSYSSTMRICDEVSQWHRAVAALCRMENPNAVSYSSVGENQWHLALHLLRRMSTCSLVPTVVNCGSCISSCQSSGYWRVSLDLLVETVQHKISANVICYGSAISACELVGHWRMAIQILLFMDEAQVKPNEISYNAAISVCARDGQLTQALILLDDMNQVRLTANVVAYTSCIMACEKGGHWQMALHLLTLEARVDWSSVCLQMFTEKLFKLSLDTVSKYPFVSFCILCVTRHYVSYMFDAAGPWGAHHERSMFGIHAMASSPQGKVWNVMSRLLHSFGLSPLPSENLWDRTRGIRTWWVSATAWRPVRSAATGRLENQHWEQGQIWSA